MISCGLTRRLSPRGGGDHQLTEDQAERNASEHADLPSVGITGRKVPEAVVVPARVVSNGRDVGDDRLQAEGRGFESRHLHKRRSVGFPREHVGPLGRGIAAACTSGDAVGSEVRAQPQHQSLTDAGGPSQLLA